MRQQRYSGWAQPGLTVNKKRGALEPDQVDGLAFLANNTRNYIGPFGLPLILCLTLSSGVCDLTFFTQESFFMSIIYVIIYVLLTSTVALLFFWTIFTEHTGRDTEISRHTCTKMILFHVCNVNITSWIRSTLRLKTIKCTNWHSEGSKKHFWNWKELIIFMIGYMTNYFLLFLQVALNRENKNEAGYSNTTLNHNHNGT